MDRQIEKYGQTIKDLQREVEHWKKREAETQAKLVQVIKERDEQNTFSAVADLEFDLDFD